MDRNITAEQWASRVSNKLGMTNVRMTPTQARSNFLGVFVFVNSLYFHEYLPKELPFTMLYIAFKLC